MSDPAQHTSRTYVITGGAGFIGSHVCGALLARGDRVVCIDNFSDYYDPAHKRANVAPFMGNPAFMLYEDDIRDGERITAIFEDTQPQRVMHLAALAGVRYSVERAALYAEVNITGTINVMDAARRVGVDNFVFASTSSIYGLTEQIPFLESQSTDFPLAPYPATKKACEVMGYAYRNMFNFNFTALRFFTVYGPRCRPDLMAYMVMDRMLRGEPITLFDAGELHRDWTYIDDIVAGVVAALDTPLGYEIINLGRGEPVRLGDFIDMIADLVGRTPHINAVPAPPSEPPQTYANVDKARRLLSYDPQTSIHDGLARTWEWFQATQLDRK